MKHRVLRAGDETDPGGGDRPCRSPASEECDVPRQARQASGSWLFQGRPPLGGGSRSRV